LSAKYHIQMLAALYCASAGPLPYDTPEVCVSRSRIVISRLAGTTATGLFGAAPAGGGTATVVFLYAGMNFRYRIGEQQLAVLEQHQGGDARDRLGHRGDAEDGVLLRRRVLLQVELA
jgi:hypothetical protein